MGAALWHPSVCIGQRPNARAIFASSSPQIFNVALFVFAFSSAAHNLDAGLTETNPAGVRHISLTSRCGCACIACVDEMRPCIITHAPSQSTRFVHDTPRKRGYIRMDFAAVIAGKWRK